MTTYAITTLHFPANVSMLATLILGVGTLVFSLIGGWFYDGHTAQKQTQLLIAPRIALTVLAYPSFLWLTHEQTPMALYIVTFGMAALTSLSAAPMLTVIPQIFPNHCRAAGMSIAYAVGVAVFGGTTQFVVAWLIQITGDPTSPTWYVAGANVVAAIALHFLCKKPLLQ
jgi:nitrate/nitrite transporter NarK